MIASALLMAVILIVVYTKGLRRFSGMQLLESLDGLVKGAEVELTLETILTALVPGTRVCAVTYETDIVSRIQATRIFAINLPTLRY